MKNCLIIILIISSFSNCKRIIPNINIVTTDDIELTPIKDNSSIVFDSIIIKNKSVDIRGFYRVNDYKTAWNSKNDRKKLINYIENIDKEGLKPEFYNIDLLKEANDSYDKASETEKIESDFLFSNTFNKVSLDLYNGHVNPKKIHSYWDIKREKLNLVATLQLALKNGVIKETLDSLLPDNETYSGLKSALEELKKAPEEDLKTFKTKRKIKINDSLPEVADLKKILIFWGDLSDKDTTQRFNKETIIALKKFQNRNGLEENGLLDAKTIKKLNISKSQKIENIIVNLERWRWYPRDLGTDYVLVNIPAYNLDVVSNGDIVNTHKIIVGTSSRKTPIISSKFNELVVNPTWTVPPTILKNDVTPKASKDTSYFSNRGFTIYDNKNNKVNAENWDPKKSTSYRYVQRPGGSNPLGRIKFNFKNKHLVYLHDTSNAKNFNRTYRAMSSGCVRVQNPFELANYILEKEQSSYDKSKISEIVKLAKPKYIRLKSQINVHLFYYTAWNSKDGIQFRDDIYNWDNVLLDNLKG